VNLAEFLLARIPEDVDEIGPASGCDCAVLGLPLRHGVRCPVRMLAECEAKRRIVEDCVEFDDESTSGAALGHRVLRSLAQVHADHPDYREEWRP
jgi:hypothetical protein